jgi:hypothetical protein
MRYFFRNGAESYSFVFILSDISTNLGRSVFQFNALKLKIVYYSKINLMKKGLLSMALFFVAGITQAQDCSELFISEYVEGWSNNKALEIYNPTASPINLSQYIVIRFSNGSTTATASYAVQLTGTIQPYSTHVGVLDKRDENGTGQEAPVWDSLQAKADAFYSPVYATNSTWYWNGNDAVVLAKGLASDPMNAQVIDIFGKIGEDPGTGWSTAFPYTGNGVVVTADHSLIRKSTILKGETNPTISFFNALAEYDSIPPVIGRVDEQGNPVLGSGGNQILDGNWSSLGWHTCDCETLNTATLTNKEEAMIYPNPSNGIVNIKHAEAVKSIEVVNALGQTVLSIENNSKSLVKIDLSANRGVYLVRFVNDDQTSTLKRVVIK